MLRFLFPYKNYPTSVNLMLLVLRLLFGVLLMWHGVVKIVNFGDIVTSFPDPLGVGSRMSLYMVIFAEVVCSMGVIVGAFYRLALIPPIFSMLIAFLVIHNHDAFAAKELALIFLVMFCLMFCMGAGSLSLDNIIASLLHKNEAEVNSVSHPVSTNRQETPLPTDDAPRQ